MIAILDCGMGNLRSVQKAFESRGFDAFLTSKPYDVKSADALVLPGVGAFGDFMDFLRNNGLTKAIIDFIDSGKPFLGICLGMQVLLEISEEFGIHKGLGVVKGVVKRFPNTVGKIPHMGWNTVKIVKDHPVLSGIKDGSFFYFVHSYYVVPDDEDIVVTKTEYNGFEFASSIGRDNLFACQFHPEKSQRLGLKIIENFGRLI